MTADDEIAIDIVVAVKAASLGQLASTALGLESINSMFGQMLAFLDGFRYYPDPATWWIGLLMLDPTVRGQGIGRKLVDGFERYVKLQGGTALMLGVVEENTAALRFWQALGFTHHSTSGPRLFGKKMQVVHVMRRNYFS